MNGCDASLAPLQGKYSDAPLVITLTRSADSTWLKIADIFAAKGLKVKSIDKSKGQIITAKTSFISAYTFEGKNGQLEEPQAWVVLPKVFRKEKQWIPKSIYSTWNIQLAETTGGQTMVKVDPVVLCTYYPNAFTVAEVSGQSTGVVEALITRN
jgi:hypothetical protein